MIFLSGQQRKKKCVWVQKYMFMWLNELLLIIYFLFCKEFMWIFSSYLFLHLKITTKLVGERGSNCFPLLSHSPAGWLVSTGWFWVLVGPVGWWLGLVWSQRLSLSHIYTRPGLPHSQVAKFQEQIISRIFQEEDQAEGTALWQRCFESQMLSLPPQSRRFPRRNVKPSSRMRGPSMAGGESA